jgi:hypothetical protein
MRVALFVLPVALGVSFGASLHDSTEESDLPIINKYVDATHTQQLALRGARMEVDIDAKLVKLKKQGRLRALRTISRLGVITYNALGFSGDNSVKREVITRYLAAESEGRENGTIAITPVNYKFKYRGSAELEGRHVAVLQLTPRKKAVGLFKGELWIDSETGMPVREAGQFVKSPSVFLKKIAFVRDYELENGVAIPKHIESTVDTRIVGRAELDINFSNFTPAEAGAIDSTEPAQASPAEQAPAENSTPGNVVPEKVMAPEQMQSAPRVSGGAMMFERTSLTPIALQSQESVR